MEVLKALPGRILANSPEDCCCDEVKFDGSCTTFKTATAFENGSEEIVIAKCATYLNETHADCTWAITESPSYNQAVTCRIDTCINKGNPLIDYKLLLALGITLYLASQFFGLYNKIREGNRDQERIAHTPKKEVHVRRLVNAYVFFRPAGSTRLFFDFGITLIILALTQRFYKTSFWAIYLFVAIPSIGTIIILLSKFYYLREIREELFELNTPLSPSSDLERNEVTEDLSDATKKALTAKTLKLVAVNVDDYSDTVGAVDVYQDFKTPFPRMFLTFVAQCSLLYIYIWTVNDDAKPDFTTYTPYFYYGLGALVQVVYNKSKGRERYEYDLYWLQCGLRFKDLFDGSVFSEKILAFHLYLRVFFSFSIDLPARDLIILLLPLNLAQSDSPMDFVLNAVAAYFITELDDLGDSREIEDWKEEFRSLKASYGGKVEPLESITSSYQNVLGNEEEGSVEMKESNAPLIEPIEEPSNMPGTS